MTLTSETISNRHSVILSMIENRAMTLTDIAAEVGVSYHTVRNDIKALMAQKMVRPAAMTSDSGKHMFIAGGNRPQPVIHIPWLNRQIPVSLLAFSFGMTVEKKTSAEEAGRVINEAILKLCSEAAEAYSTGTPPDQKSLIELRKTVANAKAILASTANVADQLLKHQVLWNNDLLPRIAEDEEFSVNDVLKANTRYLTYLESGAVNEDSVSTAGTGEAPTG